VDGHQSQQHYFYLPLLLTAGLETHLLSYLSTKSQIGRVS